MLKKSIISSFVVIAAFLLCIPACRQNTGPSQNKQQALRPVELEARLEPEEATIGDRVTYTLSLIRVPEAIAKLPELSVPEGLTLVALDRSGPRSEGGRTTEQMRATYRVDRVGTLVIPLVKMRYQWNDAEKEAETQALTLNITSVLPQNMTDIHGLKPLELPKRKPLIFLIAAFILIVAAIAAWLVRKKRKKPETVQPLLPPHLEADQRLRELEAMGLIAKGDFRKYYFLLSEIFRKYLERRFAFPAVERTPEEIVSSLDGLQATELQRHEVRTFLQITEPVKFAGAGCSQEQAMAETNRVRRFVAETRQQPLETAEEQTHVAV